ncbi:MAG TPA: acyl-CoA dehydrogenase family protein [Nitriliruptorales bacterium]
MHTVVPDDAVRIGEPFTEEHESLRGAVRRWAEDEIAPNAEQWEADEWFPDEVFRRAGELGFLGLTVPERYGGQGGDYWSTVVRAEELARGRSGSVSMALAVQSDMATPPILKFGTEQQKQDYLVPSVTGEKIACLGITEPEAGSDVARIRTRAQRVSDGWVINGSKMFITNGVRADYCTMVVRTSPADEGDGLGWSGISLFLVDTDLDGFHVSRKLDKVGMRASDTAELSFTDLHVPDTALLGTEGQGFKQIMWELQGERLISAIGAVAGAQFMFERGLEYSRQRHAFGRPIGSFQVQKHRLMDIATRVGASRRLVYEACDRWNRGEYAINEVAMVKLDTAQLSFWVADEVMQLFGGYGYSQEFPIERAWRDSRLMRIGGGTDEVQREIISKLMGL